MGLYNASYSNLIDEARLNRQAAHKRIDTIVLQITQNAQKTFFGEACHSKLLVTAGLTYQLEV